ncbi:MAG: PQQ-binding-like beta-propeller repeat protein, partial [Parvularculaceae bacterium]|nr:PQQ-binding-like beta-propeller repeat protein [Parvularculaceae bacterium]
MISLALLSAAAVAAATPAGEWPTPNGDDGATRYSAHAAITPENVRNLKRAWTFRTGHAAIQASRGSKFQATPILAGDKLVLCTPYNEAIALDPATGAALWRHDARVDLDQEPANDFNCRGVAQWADEAPATADAPCARRIFMGTNDHRLVALDLATGKACAGFGEKGVVALDPGMALRWPGEFQITSAPSVAGDVVVVGSAIADNARRAAPAGAVRAYDVRTGALLWTFDPVPRGPDAAALGWPASAPVEGHANVWAPMSVDAARGLVFLPTSSPSPDFFGGLRPGDNRHANSVVALDAKTGAVRWAFQTVHHDVWDYDVPSAPILATISVEGRRRDVVIQTTKMGFVFTLDRDTGAPVFPVEERPVPQGGVAGEALSATQPFPTAPEPLAPSKIDPEAAFGLTPLDRGACRKALASLRREGLFTPPSIQGSAVFPFTGGGANWGGGAFDPQSNYLYVNVSSLVHRIALVPRADTDEEYHPLANGEQAPMQGAPYAMQR